MKRDKVKNKDFSHNHNRSNRASNIEEKYIYEGTISDNHNNSLLFRSNVFSILSPFYNIKDKLRSKFQLDKNCLSPIIYDIYLKDISYSFWQTKKNNIKLSDFDINDKEVKDRYNHYNTDILNIITLYLGTLFNIKNNKGFFFLDHLEFNSVEYNKFRNKGALHSKTFIEKQLENKTINKKSIYLAAQKGDVKLIGLLLCHPNTINVKIKIDKAKYDKIMNFYNYKDIINKSIFCYSNVDIGLNVHGKCNECKKKLIINLGCDPTKIDDRNDIKLFDIPYILDMIRCNCDRGFLDENKIEKFGLYKCKYKIEGKMKGSHNLVNICNYTDSYIIYDFSDKNYNILWRSLNISIFV